MKADDRPNLEDYTRLIYRLALNFYDGLPECHRRWIDVDDLVSIGCAQFEYVRKKHSRRRKRKASFKTLLCTSVSRRFIDLGRGLATQSRASAGVISLEDWIPDPVFPEINPGARQRVERFMFLASPELRQLLQTRYFGGHIGRGRLPENFEALHQETLWLSARTSASSDDFRTVREELAIAS